MTVRVGLRKDDGSVTAETAIVLPALVLVVGLLLGVARAIDGELAVQDAARVGARAAARGEPAAEIHRLATEVAPPGASVEVARSAGLVEVVVRARVIPLAGVSRLLPPLDVAGRAVAADEAAAGPADQAAGGGQP